MVGSNMAIEFFFKITRKIILVSILTHYYLAFDRCQFSNGYSSIEACSMYNLTTSLIITWESVESVRFFFENTRHFFFFIKVYCQGKVTYSALVIIACHAKKSSSKEALKIVSVFFRSLQRFDDKRQTRYKLSHNFIFVRTWLYRKANFLHHFFGS